MATAQEVQHKITNWKKQIDAAKERVTTIKVEAQHAQKKMEEARERCVEIGVDPDDLDNQISNNEQELAKLEKFISDGILELGNVLDDLEDH